MIKFLDQLSESDLKGKKVLLRVDFDVTVKDEKIEDDFRIKSHKEAIDYLVNNGAKVLLVSHIGHDDPSRTFEPIIEQIGEILNHILTLVPHSELTSLDLLFNASQVLLLDNIRQDPREIQNDDGFAVSLSNGFDFYVNDAFAVSHRKHTSVAAITKYLPSYGGFLIKKEIDNLSKAIAAPAEGKVLVVGGAKISTKLPVIKNFIDKAEKILIGGALANDFFQSQGISIGNSVTDDNVSPDVKSPNIILPHDILVSSDKTGQSGVELSPIKNINSDQTILDIGSETAKSFADIIKNSKMVIWNGPMGLSEVKAFAAGTVAVARAVAGASYSIVGGGDTITAADKLGLLDHYSFVSTGGGAMLDFLAGNDLPGLVALGYDANL